MGKMLGVNLLPGPSSDLGMRTNVMPLRGGEQMLTFPRTCFESGRHPWWLSGRLTLTNPVVSPGSLTYILRRILGAILDGGLNNLKPKGRQCSGTDGEHQVSNCRNESQALCDQE